MERLKSEKNPKSTLSQKDAAAKVWSVDAAFEEAFVMLCYLLQAQAKFITYASALDVFEEDSIETLKNELLQGPCAELTSHITQQCLFVEEDDDNMFTFTHPDVSKNTEKGQNLHGLPQHCLTADMAARCHPRSYLLCPPPLEPLPVLRESFSGNVSVTLSQQWILCSGACYLGGVCKDDVVHGGNDKSDTTPHVRPGNMDGFLSHVKENCLTLCGTSFKRLDKKSEKSFLFAMKQGLTGLSSAAIDPEQILECTIMILFQQVQQAASMGHYCKV
jgi:hypothetical protein